MLAIIQRYFPLLQLLLIALLGSALGQLSATVAGLYLAPSTGVERPAPKAAPIVVAGKVKHDRNAILRRNIFNSAAPDQAPLILEAEPGKDQTSPQTQASSAPPANLTLLGTVVAGDKSLALIRKDREIEVYSLDEDIPGGGTLVEVQRKLVRLKRADGSHSELPLHEGNGGSSAPAPAKPVPARRNGQSPISKGIRSVGENRWVISQSEVEKARGNLNELLKQARMEPNIVNGQTDGFAVKMVRPRTLLALLGIRVGDIIREVNGVQLDSPEKALQVFQQLREARNISIGLSRRGKDLTFEYEVE